MEALRAVCHNYPDSVLACWLQVSGLLKGYLNPDVVQVPLENGAVGGGGGGGGGLSTEKVIAAAVKVLDEFLRAITGFRGTEDVDGDKTGETPFLGDLKRDKRISSAPSYGAESLKDTSDESEACTSGVVEWSEAIEKHLAVTLCHTSSVVRFAFAWPWWLFFLFYLLGFVSSRIFYPILQNWQKSQHKQSRYIKMVKRSTSIFSDILIILSHVLASYCMKWHQLL